MSENSSVQIDKLVHRRLKVLAALTGKKLYQLIAEAVDYLESRYRV